MSSIADLFRQADKRLQSQAKVAGLTEAAAGAGLDEMPLTSEALVVARRLLADRTEALAAAQRQVRQLEDTVAQLSRALPFLEGSWPWQRDLLRKAISDDAGAGLAEWLNYWFAAASARRFAALRRLQSDVSLPGEYRVMGERLAVAARGLAEDDWLPCREILLLGAAGVRVGRRQVPDRLVPDRLVPGGHEPDLAVREDLRLLAARLALHNGRLDEAGDVLGTDESAPRLALRSQLARLRGDVAQAEALFRQSRDYTVGDLDVVAESITRARQRGDMDGALDDARAVVEALPSLADIDGDMGRLVGPPSELWIALAERARDEEDDDSARGFLRRAIADRDGWVFATAQEVHATVAASAAERGRARLLAGYWRASLGQLDRARQDYKAAAADGTPSDPADADVQAAARLRLADVIALTARQRPYRAAADELANALGLVDSARPRQHWSYLTETDLHIQLSRVPGREDRPRQEWAALMAAATAVSLEPGWAASWLALADAATTLDLHLVAETAAARAHQIEPGDEATRASYVRALVNSGDYNAALKYLGDAGEPGDPGYPWRQCMHGLIALRQGQADEAAGHYADLAIDPAWLWAWNASIRALVITGELDAARQESAKLMRMRAGREDERAWLAVAAFDARLNGQLDTAAGLAERLSKAAGQQDYRTQYARAEARLLGGYQDGWDLLTQALAADSRPAALDVWEREELPVLAALTRDRGVPLKPPAGLESAVRELRDKAHPGKPVAELRLAEEAAGDEAGEAADLIEAALLTPVPDDLPARPSHGRAASEPLSEPPVLELRLPASWLAKAEPSLDTELRQWAAGKKIKLSGAEDLKPDRYQLLAGGKVRADGPLGPGCAATPADLLTGKHRLAVLLTWPAAEVIAAAYYLVTPTRSLVPVTVSWLAHRSWELRGKPTGSDRTDWDVAEAVFHQFVAEHAYFRWEKRHGPLFGDPLEDWLPAEREIKGEDSIPGAVVDERLHTVIAYFNWLDRGRPFGSPLADWPE